MSNISITSRFPNLGKLSIAILEHTVKPVIGEKAIDEIKSPVVEKNLLNSLETLLEKAEKRFIAQYADREICGIILNLPLSNLPSVVQAVRIFYSNPNDTTLSQILIKQLETLFPKTSSERITSGVSAYIKFLKDELANLNDDIRDKLGIQATLEIQNNTTQIAETLDRIAKNIAQGLEKPETTVAVSKSNPRHELFLHHLKEDAIQLANLTQERPNIQIIETEGTPPTKYVFEYQVKGIIGVDEKGKPRYSNKHIVEILVHDDYPLSMPFVQFYSPIFHPNIWTGGKVCLGWFPIPYQLTDICLHIAKMIDYQVYDLNSPSNNTAANWANLNRSLFPLERSSSTDFQAQQTQNEETTISSLKMLDTKKEIVKVDVVITRTGQRHSIEVALDSLVRYIQDELIKTLNLPQKLENGWSIAYHLYNKRAGKMLNDNLTFRQNDIKDGDTLSFHIETLAG